MRNKRKNSSFSDEVGIDSAEQDLEYDSRWARRVKRRLASDIDNKLNSSGNNSFKGGKCNGASVKSEVVNLDIDGDIVFDMRLARRWKRSLASNTEIKPNSSGRNSVSRGKCNVGAGGDFSIDDDNGDVEPDYKQYLDSLDDGSCENMALQIEPLNIDADAIHMGNPKSNNRGEIVEDASYYRSYLNILALEDENACFLDRGVDVDAVDGFTEKDSRAEDSVGDKHMMYDASDADNCREQKRNSDCTDGVAAAVVAEPIKKGTLENFSSDDSDDIDVNGESSEIPFGKNDAFQDDDVPDIDAFQDDDVPDIDAFQDDDVPDIDAFQDDDVPDIDPAYDYVLKNMVKDTNVSSIDFSDDDGDNETSPNDDLDYTEPEYEIFMKNIRQEGKSLVLEIPALDGISQIIRYELGDACGVDNPEATRSTKKDLHQPDLADEAYGEFIKCLKSERGLVVYTPECGPKVKVVYDVDEEDSNSSDSDVVILENGPFVPTYEIPSDEEEEKCNKSWNRKDSWFRDEVMAILKKPFDREEFNRLLKDATAHRPMIKEGDLRGGRSRLQNLNKSAKSYVDVHRDLREQIRLAGPSEPKVLNLLRGFFSWLQNAPHEVFKPWKDEQCLQVMPSPEVSGKCKYEVSF